MTNVKIKRKMLTKEEKIFEILGVDDIPKDNDLHAAEVRMIRRGLPITAFKQVASFYDISESEVAALLGTSDRTIYRYQKEHKPLNANWSDRLFRLARIAARATEVFESAETARKWLKRSNRALSGATPVEMLDTDAGAEQVNELLTRIDYGVYS